VYNEGFRKVNKVLHNSCNVEFHNINNEEFIYVYEYNEGFRKLNNELHDVCNEGFHNV